MGLMDILNGMSNGPHGNPKQSGGGRGMSPLTMGLLALLAYKAYRSGTFGNLLGGNNPGGNNQAGNNPQASPNSPPGNPNANQNTGGLGDWLGKALGGGAGGSIVNGGLGELVKRFQDNGYGNVADSWVGKGPNAPISPNDLSKAAGAEDLDALARELGVSRDQMLAGLSKDLPGNVDQLTPQGRLPA
jgi:uncharacterized protein YidB (DUF937 family)